VKTLRSRASAPGWLGEGLPSGEHTKNYRKSPFFIGKPSINGPFSIAMLVYQRVAKPMGSAWEYNGNLMGIYE